MHPCLRSPRAPHRQGQSAAKAKRSRRSRAAAAGKAAGGAASRRTGKSSRWSTSHKGIMESSRPGHSARAQPPRQSFPPARARPLAIAMCNSSSLHATQQTRACPAAPRVGEDTEKKKTSGGKGEVGSGRRVLALSVLLEHLLACSGQELLRFEPGSPRLLPQQPVPMIASPGCMPRQPSGPPASRQPLSLLPPPPPSSLLPHLPTVSSHLLSPALSLSPNISPNPPLILCAHMVLPLSHTLAPRLQPRTGRWNGHQAAAPARRGVPRARGERRKAKGALPKVLNEGQHHTHAPRLSMVVPQKKRRREQRRRRPAKARVGVGGQAGCRLSSREESGSAKDEERQAGTLPASAPDTPP